MVQDTIIMGKPNLKQQLKKKEERLIRIQQFVLQSIYEKEIEVILHIPSLEYAYSSA